MERKFPTSYFKSNGNEMVLRSDRDPMPDIHSTVRSANRQKIIQKIDKYRKRIENQRIDRQGIKNRLKLLQMREEVYESGNLSKIEQELSAMWTDIECSETFQ